LILNCPLPRGYPAKIVKVFLILKNHFLGFVISLVVIFLDKENGKRDYNPIGYWEWWYTDGLQTYGRHCGWGVWMWQEVKA
jgi:hypothetical protein